MDAKWIPKAPQPKWTPNTPQMEPKCVQMAPKAALDKYVYLNHKMNPKKGRDMGPTWARFGLSLRTFRDPLRAHNCSYENAPHAGESSIFKVLASKRVPKWVQNDVVLSSFCTLLATDFAHTTFLTKMHPMQARAPFSRLGPRNMGPKMGPK